LAIYVLMDILKLKEQLINWDQASLNRLIRSTEDVKQGLNAMLNLLILSEDELTEQCGVNTSNTFNTPKPPGELDPETWKCEVVPGVGKTQTPDLQVVLNDPEIWECKELYGLDGSRTDDFADPTAELSPAEFADLEDAEMSEEAEPRKPTPVEKLIDAVLRVQAVGLVDMAKEAQAFLDQSAD